MSGFVSLVGKSLILAKRCLFSLNLSVVFDGKMRVFPVYCRIIWRFKWHLKMGFNWDAKCKIGLSSNLNMGFVPLVV